MEMIANLWIATAIMLSFLGGFVIGASKIFPYDYLSFFAFSFLKESSMERTPHYCHQENQFKELSCRDAKIMMLGDSITEDGRWNEIFEREDIINRGIGGNTVHGALQALQYCLNPGLKKAFVMVGINDISRGNDARNIFKTYRLLLETLNEHHVIPIVQSTLYVGESKPGFYNHQVRELNDLLKSYCLEHRIDYVDLNPLLAPHGYLEGRFTIDGLHINGKGYTIWAEKIRHYF